MLNVASESRHCRGVWATTSPPHSNDADRIIVLDNGKITGFDTHEALLASNEIYREYEFILEDSGISNSLIQGIIDLFFVTSDGKVILVDFKTDRLESEQEFIKRYKIQLDIYKKAINSLTRYNVDLTYIYSFNLDKEIEIKEEEDE